MKKVRQQIAGLEHYLKMTLRMHSHLDLDPHSVERELSARLRDLGYIHAVKIVESGNVYADEMIVSFFADILDGKWISPELILDLLSEMESEVEQALKIGEALKLLRKSDG